MKKTLVALAALAATGAFAQVTLSGVMDLNVGKSTSSTAGVDTSVGYRLASGGLSGSRMKLAGEEDLGGGMKVSFVQETAVAADAPAASTLGSRQSILGISSGAAQLTLGRQYTPLDNIMGTFDVTGYSGFSALSAINGGASADSGRWSDSVMGWYVANGLTVQLAYSFGENGTNSGGGNATSNSGLWVNYATGPFAVGATVESSQAAVGGATTASTALGGSYDLGAAKVAALWVRQDNGAGTTDTGYNLSVGVPMGASTINVSYGRDGSSAAAGNTDVTALAFEYRYSLSKRSTAYFGYNSTNSAPPAAAPSTNVTTYGAGLRHTF